MNVRESLLYGLVILSVPAAWTQPHPGAPPVVTRSCSGCHGMDGNPQLPYVPRLSGLKAPYLESRLSTYRSAGAAPVDEAFARAAGLGKANGSDEITAAAKVQMAGVASAISEKEVKEAAEWFSGQKPGPGKAATGSGLEEGRKLYAEGDKAQGIVACQSCHGAEAQGSDFAPRLAGQSAAYVVDQLALFRAGGRRNAAGMAGIARALQPDQARAVAQYLQAR